MVRCRPHFGSARLRRARQHLPPRSLPTPHCDLHAAPSPWRTSWRVVGDRCGAASGSTPSRSPCPTLSPAWRHWAGSWIPCPGATPASGSLRRSDESVPLATPLSTCGLFLHPGGELHAAGDGALCQRSDQARWHAAGCGGRSRSKTTQIAALMENQGMLIANEFSAAG